jgi:hypothetical protein
MMCGTAENRASRNGGQRRKSAKMLGKIGFFMQIRRFWAFDAMLRAKFIGK